MCVHLQVYIDADYSIIRTSYSLSAVGEKVLGIKVRKSLLCQTNQTYCVGLPP